MPKARLNYSISDATSVAMEAYCTATSRKAADVVRQVILDYLQEGAEPISTVCRVHPSDKRADLWVQSGTIQTLDARCASERHVTRSALIDALVASFLLARPIAKTVTLVLEIPSALYNTLAKSGDPHGAVIRAIQSSVEPVKECV